MGLKCQDAVKEEKDWEKEVPNVIARYYVITFKGSQSPQSEGWQEEVVLKEFLDLSMKKLEEFSKFFWKMSSGMLSHTLSMPKGKPLLQWTLFMLSKDKDALCTDLVDKMSISNKSNSPFQD